MKEIRKHKDTMLNVLQTFSYNLKNHLGSVGLCINHSGSTIDREEYYPFGDSSLRTFTKKRYRYCGKEKDEESGLYYYGARYYMSWACRFISIDPLCADYMHLTPYNYAGNKPISYYDIDGLQGNGEQQSNTDFKQPVVTDNTNVQNLYKIDQAPELRELDTTIRPTVDDSAILADDIYNYTNLKAGTTLIDEKDGEVEGTDFVLKKVSVGKDGFTAGLYKKTLDDGTEIFALAFAGTEDWKDWIANAKQGLGLYNSQYDMAYDMAQMYKDYSNITFVGHSLGGGLASLAALSTDKPGITFNAAGLSGGTKDKYGITNTTPTDRVEAYVIKGEILNRLLKPFGQGAIGNKHSLTSKMDWYTYNEFMEKHATNSNLPHEQWSALYENYVGHFRMENHGMNMVKKALNIK